MSHMRVARQKKIGPRSKKVKLPRLITTPLYTRGELSIEYSDEIF